MTRHKALSSGRECPAGLARPDARSSVSSAPIAATSDSSPSPARAVTSAPPATSAASARPPNGFPSRSATKSRTASSSSPSRKSCAAPIPTRLVPPLEDSRPGCQGKQASPPVETATEILLIPPPPKQTARAMRPLWRDLILKVWGADPLQCPCCKPPEIALGDGRILVLEYTSKAPKTQESAVPGFSKNSLAKRAGKLFSRLRNLTMILTKSPISPHDPAGPPPWTAPGLRFLHRFSPLFPRNPFFPALRSGHRLFQRPSPQKQIPSIL